MKQQVQKSYWANFCETLERKTCANFVIVWAIVFQQENCSWSFTAELILLQTVIFN